MVAGTLAPSLVQAVDGEQLLLEKICAESLTVSTAVTISYFDFKRQDGFLCASRVLDTLVAELASQPALHVTSSRLFWALFKETVKNPANDETFKRIATSIRLAYRHPLQAQARLGLLRLSVLRGGEIKGGLDQTIQILEDLGYFSGKSFQSTYASASPPLREALRWIVATDVLGRLSTAKGMPIASRLDHLSWVGEHLASLSAHSPELLRHVVAQAWRSGKQIIGSSLDAVAPKNPHAVTPFQLSYHVCADSACTSHSGNMSPDITLQLIKQDHSLSHTDAGAFIQYSLRSSAIQGSYCSTCAGELDARSVGRFYYLEAYSWTRGGAQYVNSVIGEAGGLKDHLSSISYNIKNTVDIPQCNWAPKCSPSVNIYATLNAVAHDQKSTTLITLKDPQGVRTTLSAGETRIDRSAGNYEIEFHISRSDSNKGWVAGPRNFLSLNLVIMEENPIQLARIEERRAELAEATPSQAHVLALTLASEALARTRDGFSFYFNEQAQASGSQTPKALIFPKIGLGQALGILADAPFSARWDAVYAPLLYIHVLRQEIGVSLPPDERRALDMARNIMSGKAIKKYETEAKQQSAFLASILPALTTSSIDAAINAIQRAEDFNSQIGPLLAVLASDAAPSPATKHVKVARDYLDQAIKSDNLLDAVLLLYRAREKMETAAERVATEIDLLTVEQAGLSTKGIKP